jgi:hypothetical protein
MQQPPNPGPGRWHHFLDVPNQRWLTPAKCTENRACRFCFDQRKGVKQLNKDGSNFREVATSILAYYKKHPEPNKYFLQKINYQGNNISNMSEVKKSRGRPKKVSESLPVEPIEEVPIKFEQQKLAAANSPLSRKKFHTANEVWAAGEAGDLQTRQGYKFDDLVQTPKGKVVSKKRLESLAESSKRLVAHKAATAVPQ